VRTPICYADIGSSHHRFLHDLRGCFRSTQGLVVVVSKLRERRLHKQAPHTLEPSSASGSAPYLDHSPRYREQSADPWWADAAQL
jgi:hypothetical protein